MEEYIRLEEEKARRRGMVFNWETSKVSSETLYCEFRVSFDDEGYTEMDIEEKDKNKAKNDKTEHGMEKIEKDKVIRSQKSKVKSRGQQKSTSRKSK
nr:hypothetical protein [Tanacetum cinerariifolium]